MPQRTTAMADRNPRQDDASNHRPSFVNFWKRGKELALGQGRRRKEVTFVRTRTGGPGSSGNDDPSEDPSQGNDSTPATPESKAAQRRAQVRRAQIQHRQRKANYVKELEQEVAKIRKQIDDVDKERRVLRVENDSMRAELRASAMVERRLLRQPRSQPQQQQQIERLGTGPWYMSDEMDFKMTMQLGYDEVLGAPCYMVSGLSSSISPSTAIPTGEPGATNTISTAATHTLGPGMLPTPPRTATFGPGYGSSPSIGNSSGHGITTITEQQDAPELPHMTPPQIQTAINFILALEHICRDHFHPSHISPSPSPSPSLNPFHSHSGHSLMATSLALQSAPSSIFSAAKKTKLFPGSSINIKPPSTSKEMEWENSALTLRNLYRLSKALEKGGEDEMEVTPVQAWFELVSGYGLGRVMEGIGELKREMGRRKGAVRCPHYGARIGRGEWEEIVGEVMGDR
ncbi:hypothetical protein B0T21DRAFT_356065 [Apiosordaria backusii]|uniref:BZIP domain-containing protein n=1 Tax=Apiosordaria backusii TaxID=314023 RepID=A0AA40EZ44_9PEZI|nr:hypothetical protein B0T21DRAFT_356065 [Apiosordaria backusii]